MNLDFSVIYSDKRKKLSITVERDRSIVVRAPEGTSLDKIRQVVESKKKWMFEKTHHSQKYDALPHPPGKELVNGESMLYLGKNYRIEIVSSCSDSIQFFQKFIVPSALLGKRKEVFREWYLKKAKEKILPRIRQHAKSLGVAYNEAKITDSRYRWGSCTLKDNLNFNWRLIKAPMYVVDYVIVHELAHLLEANHTPRFWNIVRSQVTNLDKAKAWLRDNGEVLEENL